MWPTGLLGAGLGVDVALLLILVDSASERAACCEAAGMLDCFAFLLLLALGGRTAAILCKTKVNLSRANLSYEPGVSRLGISVRLGFCGETCCG